jgi:YD repeat-containing protein
MRRAHRLPKRLVRLTSLCACLALVLTSLAMVPPLRVSGRVTFSSTQDKQDPDNGKARKVKAEPPQQGPPSMMLPDLDEVKRKHEREPEVPLPIPSTMRSKRRPVGSRGGKKVGDPGTTGGSIGFRTGSDSDRVNRSPEARATGLDRVAKRIESFSPRSSAKTSATSALDSWSTPAGDMLKRTKRNHAGRPMLTRGLLRRAASPTPLGDDQFIQNFFYWALLRYPNSTELAYWDEILRTAYPQGQTAMQISIRELGMTLFESAEYSARNRSNYDYVYDLYKTYLMRDPDQGGWNFWTGQVPIAGRENVRHAFEECGEYFNLVATLTPNGSASGNAASLSTARVDPSNQTGNQLLARDCEWSVGLLNLPGRAGLDLGLGLSYSSLVWTRSGPYLYFDEDNGSPSPGFRLGFATIQWPYFDAQVGRNVYMLITSSGHRVELRQLGTSNIYEAGDSSYLQLTVNGSSLLLRTTDGTQMSYARFENEWRATQIKDRNGNYLTVNYNGYANITNITDTLGRVITFSYDSNANPLSITQSWNGTTHTWATFGWGTVNMQPGFSGVSVVGTHPGEIIPVLTQVGLGDGSFFTFQYTGAGQVNLIRRYTSDYVQRSYTAYDYAAATSDCPRISQTRVWADNWTAINGVPSEVVTQYNEPGDGSHQLIAPDGTVFKEFYGTGWQKGLTTQSEVWSGGVRQKWTTTSFIQDNTGVSYQTNPRVTETNVYDSAGNRRRTTIDYQGSFALPWIVADFAADGVTTIRRTYYDYKSDSAYIDRRIIGLLFRHSVYDGSWNLKSKTEYGYDWGSEHMQSLPQAAVQHDGANYPASFIFGRGNLCVVSRWDATDPNNSSKVLETKYGYNNAGLPTFTRDPLWHQNFFSYTDSFSDSVNRNTFAYPTTITNADGYQSLAQYNYDFGATTRTQGPPPGGQSQGAIQTITYDSVARVDRVTTTNTGAYTRYWYGPNYVASLATVNNVADEAYTNRVFDGAGRLTGVANNNPGSSGGYKAQITQYDLMGRVMKQSNPTEINGSWAPAGDDAAGFVYTQQTYDWKGRPLVTTNTDGTQKYASYSACGCAGSEVVTLTDEVGRQQKIYNDALGRMAKTEVLNWNSTVYSTTANTYSELDQVSLVRQYQGADTSGVYQDTTMTYDGYGRLQTKHMPEQNAGTSTVYAYNADDTVQSVTDARGASATYSYNGRHLVTGINYSAPAGITPTSNVLFGYDAAGNRTSMTDGLGSKSYTYNQLSQLVSEARTFNGVGTFTLSYDYNLAGELKSITDPAGATINYGFDGAARINAVTGSTFGGVSQYASNIQYRASGVAKGLSYGDSLTMTASYNSRLQPTHFQVSNVISKDYQYHADGRTRYSADLLNNRFDRSYDYDHAGRILDAFSGPMARGEADITNRPYKQYYQYDAMSNLTGRVGSKLWENASLMYSPTSTYTNNRNNSWSYDADGRMTSGVSGQYTYDASGRAITAVTGSASRTQNLSYDGDGVRTKLVDSQTTNGVTTTTISYTITSTVLGQPLTELSDTGQKTRSFVYLQGEVLAWQQKDGSIESVLWEHRDPSNASYRMVGPGGSIDVDREAELDPQGSDAGVISPYNLPHHQWPGQDLTYPGFADMISGNCAIDGIAAPCSMRNRLMEREAATMENGGIGKDRDRIYKTRSPFKDYGVGLVGIRMFDGARGNDGQTRLALFIVPQHAAHPDPCLESVSSTAPGLVKDGAYLLLNEGRRSNLTAAQMAYVFASAQHETDQGKTMFEYASGKAYEGRADLGNSEEGDGARFKGRGFVQITGRKNYKLYSDLLGIDLVGNPDLAADMTNSAKITVDGMVNGRFTGMAMNHYINDEGTDFYHARAVVNGDTEKNGERIAGYARSYLKVLTDCGFAPSASVRW